MLSLRLQLCFDVTVSCRLYWPCSANTNFVFLLPLFPHFYEQTQSLSPRSRNTIEGSHNHSTHPRLLRQQMRQRLQLDYETLSRIKGGSCHPASSSTGVDSSSLTSSTSPNSASSNKINNHYLLSNNLLSSSVRDLLSSNNPSYPHETSSTLVDTMTGRTTTLIRGTSDDSREYDYPSTTTCLLTTQSGSRFVMTDSPLGHEAGLPPLPAPNSSVLMRGIPGGITTSRTIGSKVSRPGIIGTSTVTSSSFHPSSQHHLYHPGSFPTFNSIQSRFSKSDSSFKMCTWKTAAIILMVLCVMLFFSLLYALLSNRTSWSSECSCPVEDGSVSSPSASSLHPPEKTDSPSFQCPVLCSGRGAYVGGSCECQPGFKGKECQLKIEECDPKDCNGNGVCVEGECACKTGWKGSSCLTPSNECEVQDCNGHGLCQSGVCKCSPGFKGIHCEHEDCQDPSCSSHGVCFGTQCICDSGWKGDNCSILSVAPKVERCPSSCSGPDHGECVNVPPSASPYKPNPSSVHDKALWKCSCKPGWTGVDCSEAETKQPTEINCSDGIDNDNDGLIDCADSECCSHKHCQHNPLCFASPDPRDILQGKQPVPPNASFFERMKFLIEEDSVQNYAHKQAFNER